VPFDFVIAPGLADAHSSDFEHVFGFAFRSEEEVRKVSVSDTFGLHPSPGMRAGTPKRTRGDVVFQLEEFHVGDEDHFVAFEMRSRTIS